MSRICQITGKKLLKGNNVSHSNNKKKRYFNINFFKKKFFIPSLGRWIKLKVSAKGIKMINKLGIDHILKQKNKYYGKKK